MKGIWFPVLFVTVFLFIYAALALSQLVPQLVLMMFVASPFLVIWMVYRVLRDGKPSGRTFNEHFYDDIDYRRIPDRD